MKPAGRARLVDVAERAGVTVSTASRAALARPEMVRPVTRERVVAAAAELGYVPNRMARGLITGRSSMIVLLVPDLTSPMFGSIARAVEEAAQQRGFDLMIADVRRNEAREAATIESVSMFADGIIVCMPRGTYAANPVRPPIVTVNRRTRGAHAVLIDQAAVIELQLEHLQHLGHERIYYLGGSKEYWPARKRRRHAERLAGVHGIELSQPTEITFEAGVELAELLEPDITAVMTYSDVQALGFIARCAELGIRVPDDVSVIGANDVLLARMVAPALTTVRAPVEALGSTAVSLLVDHVDARHGPQIVETHTSELVVRSSTAPPRDHLTNEGTLIVETTT